jgi:GPH family glycoside/pentoside/hexuronide:cation symporter
MQVMPVELASEEERVPVGVILTYSTPLLAIFLSNALVGLYLLKFATDSLLIAPALVGMILLGARVWDAVSDPLVGYLSDRTQTRWGRRRPWFAVSALPLGLAIIALWSPPASLGENAVLAWFAVAVVLYYTAYTGFRVPHLAMGAELSRGYHDRTRVFGVMQAVENFGMSLGAVTLYFLERASDQRVFAGQLSVGIALATVALIWIATARIRERSEFQGRGGTSPFASFRDVFANPHARLLLGIFFAEQLGFSTLIVLLPYLSDYILETQGNTAIYAGSALGTMVVSIPLWVHLARRIGKRPIWLFCTASKVGVFAFIYTLQKGEMIELLVATAFFGFFSGCGAVVGPSLKADVVDWDESRTGERKEGAYFATWNFAQKTAGGIAIGMTGGVLAMTGYQPNVAQTEEALWGMRFLSSAFPAGLHVIAALMVFRFGLDEATHRQARLDAEGG